MKSVGHSNTGRLSRRLLKPQLDKGWHPPEVISPTFPLLLCQQTLISFLYLTFVWYSPLLLLDSLGPAALSCSVEGILTVLHM